MARLSVEPTLYPLAWDESYERKGSQWRGGVAASDYLPLLDLSGDLLEIGAGNGNAARAIARAMPPGSRLVCIDVSGVALGMLPHSLRGDERVSAAVSDARSAPFRRQSFKTIFVRHVLTHAIRGDESRVLSEVRRLLAPGGRAYVEVFAVGDMRQGKGCEIDEGVYVHGDGLVWRFFDASEMRRCAKKAGLKIARLDSVSKVARYRGRPYPRESLVAIMEPDEG